MLRQRSEIYRILRWGFVGFTTAVFDSFTYELARTLGLGTWLANLTATVLAICLNFALHRFWTFREARALDKFTLVKYLIQYLIMFVLTGLLLVSIGSQLSPFFAKLFAIGITSPLGFVLMRFWVFRPPKRS